MHTLFELPSAESALLDLIHKEAPSLRKGSKMEKSVNTSGRAEQNSCAAGKIFPKNNSKAFMFGAVTSVALGTAYLRGAIN